MVHTFEVDGKYYLFDVESSALHECDALTAEVIKKMQGQPYFLEGADEEAVREIEADIKELKEKGLLFAKRSDVRPEKSEHLKALCLHICHDCNMRCAYCFASEGTYKGERQMMSFEVAKAAIDFLIKNSGDRKILETDFFGGEPLMNLGVIKKTVAYAREQGKKYGKTFLFTLTTNGILLNEETAEWLNEEMENVVMSLDGRKEVNDAIRKTVNGKGSFDVIINNFKRFVKIRGNKSYYIRGTFTNKNLDFGEDVKFIADQGFKEISVEPVVLPKGDPLAIPDDALPAIREEYRRLSKEYIKRKKEGRGFNFFHFVIDIEGGPCLSKRVNACGAGNEYLSVTPKGDLYPCHQFSDNPKFYMGNVFEGEINREIRGIFKNSSLFTREKCDACFARYHCSGGCAANNYNFNGDVNKPYEPTCEMMRARLECALHILAETKQ
ncbi:MAG: thioether cross-link-forming SCIFF peptide maturase [Clostridia bacterium]|nr:thioether cross-link-forming SCIFF peptide maturase [Clostridia bacterium]